MDTPDTLPPSTDDEGLSSGDAARERALTEGSGFSPYLARIAVRGAGVPVSEADSSQASSSVRRTPAPRARRIGRPGNPGTDRDFEPIPPYVQLTAAEVTARQGITRRGRERVEQEMGARNFEKDVAAAARLGISVESATRIRIDRQSKRGNQTDEGA